MATKYARRRYLGLGLISPIDFDRLNVQNKNDAKVQEPAAPVDNAVHAQPEFSIACDRQVNLIDTTEEVKNQ